MYDYDEIDNMINQICEEEDIDKSLIFVIPSGEIDNKILEVEKILNLVLPDSYKWFLRNYGSGGMEDYDYFGIECDRDDVSMYTVVYMTEMYRKKGLDNYLVVIEYNGDYVTCIDTSQKDNNGESPIVTWSWLDNGKIIEKSDNFADYLKEKLKDYV